MLYSFVWELAFTKPLTSKGGNARNQTVCHSEDVRLYNLLVITVPVQDAVPGEIFVLVSPNGMLWDPDLEAHPLDPSASWNNKLGVSQECFLAMAILDKLRKPVKEKAAASGERVTMEAEVGNVDDGTLAKLLGELTLDHPANPLAPHVQFNEQWQVCF